MGCVRVNQEFPQRGAPSSTAAFVLRRIYGHFPQWSVVHIFGGAVSPLPSPSLFLIVFASVRVLSAPSSNARPQSTGTMSIRRTVANSVTVVACLMKHTDVKYTGVFGIVEKAHATKDMGMDPPDRSAPTTGGPSPERLSVGKTNGIEYRAHPVEKSFDGKAHERAFPVCSRPCHRVPGAPERVVKERRPVGKCPAKCYSEYDESCIYWDMSPSLQDLSDSNNDWAKASVCSVKGARVMRVDPDRWRADSQPAPETPARNGRRTEIPPSPRLRVQSWDSLQVVSSPVQSDVLE